MNVVTNPEKVARPRVNLLAILALAIIDFLACATTTLAPQAERVKTTTNADDVRDCKMLGTVEARTPFNTPSEPWIQMRNQTAALGGNMVLRTKGPGLFSKSWYGLAYQCEGKRR